MPGQTRTGPPVAAMPAFTAPATPDPRPTPATAPRTAEGGPPPAATSPGPPEYPEPGPRTTGPMGGLRRLLGSGPDTRTGTFSEDGPTGSAPAPATRFTKADATELGIAIVGAAAVLAAVLVRLQSRGRRRLRPPTDDQADDIGEPVGRILYRHAGLARLGPDVVDVIKAVSATGAYINDGPITEDVDVEPSDSGFPGPDEEE